MLIFLLSYTVSELALSRGFKTIESGDMNGTNSNSTSAFISEDESTSAPPDPPLSKATGGCILKNTAEKRQGQCGAGLFDSNSCSPMSYQTSSCDIPCNPYENNSTATVDGVVWPCQPCFGPVSCPCCQAPSPPSEGSDGSVSTVGIVVGVIIGVLSVVGVSISAILIYWHIRSRKLSIIEENQRFDRFAQGDDFTRGQVMPPAAPPLSINYRGCESMPETGAMH